MRILKRRRHDKQEAEIELGRDTRTIVGASATLANVGPARSSWLDDEELDIVEGTTSGMGLRGKPARGSIERQGL